MKKAERQLDLMTTEEAAEFLKVKPETLRKKSSSRLIPHYRIPGAGVRFDRGELSAWVEQWKIIDRYAMAEEVMAG